MILITWNVQWCRGCDGRVDPARIVHVARALADFDVLCLQEVAAGFPGLPGSSGEDQFERIEAALPGYALIDGVAVDRRDGGVLRRFGNLIATRWPVVSVHRHLLPWPADGARLGMQRVALEAVLHAPTGPLRVTTTHLEYYSALQRGAQVQRLRELHAEACAHAADPRDVHPPDGPFGVTDRPVSSILTGDFNFRPDAPEYAAIQAPIAAGVPAYRDAWAVLFPGREHEPTVGVHDRAQWPQRFACDFVFLSEDLAPRVQSVRADQATDASDHQPVVVELG